MSCWVEHDLGARRAPARGMAGFVLRADIGLGFYNSPDRRSVRMLSNQIFAKQLPGDINGGLLVERTENLHGLREDFLKPLGQLFAEFVSLTRVVFRRLPLVDVERHFLQRC